MTDDQGTARRGTEQGEEDLPEARRRRTRWPGWVWAIPLAAVILAGWLGAKEWVIGSGDVTVRFANAQGVSSGAAVRYKGTRVGRVEEVRLGDDLDEVELVLSIEEPLSGHLGAGTMFWIERPELAQGDIMNLVAGAHVVVQPVEGEAERVFEGLEAPPVIAADRPGRRFLLVADDAGGLSRGAPVLFRGVEVGSVLGTRLNREERQVRVPVFVEEEYADLVTQGSVFWRAGGLSLSMAGGLDAEFPPLPALISGAIAFDTPEVFSGPPAEPDAVFRLHGSRDKAQAVATGAEFPYFVRFPTAVGGLEPGAPVQLQGRQVGHVAEVGLEVGGESGAFATPVRIALDALAFDIDAQAAESREALRERLNETVAALVRNGLRAQISSGGFLSGGKSVNLVIVSGAEPATLDQGHEPPAIPAVSPDSE